MQGDEPLLRTFNRSLLGGQKEWSLKVQGGASPQAATWQDLRPVSIFNSTPPTKTLWSKKGYSLKVIGFSSNSTSSHPVFFFLISDHPPWTPHWLRCPPLDTGLTLRGAILAPLGRCVGLIVQSGSEVCLAPRGHPCGVRACEIEGELTKSAHSLCILAGSQDGAEGDNHFKL